MNTCTCTVAWLTIFKTCYSSAALVEKWKNAVKTRGSDCGNTRLAPVSCGSVDDDASDDAPCR